LDIKELDIKDIKRAKYNPRVKLKPGMAEYEKLKKSLDEFGLVEPLVWNKKTGNLVGGHQRLDILEGEGHTTVTVAVVDLDKTKEKALNIALNKIMGYWDTPALKDLLGELDTGEFDLEITGFDMGEIKDLMLQLHDPFGEADLPTDLPTPELTGEDARSQRFILVYKDDTEKQLWMDKLGIDGSRVVYRVDDIC